MLRTVAFGGVVLGVWLGAGVVQLVRAAAEASEARNEVEALRDSLQAADLYDDVSLSGRLTEARARFEQVSARVSSVWTAPYRVLPVAGRQLASLDSLARGSALVLNEVDAVLATVRDVRQAELSDGSSRIAAAREVADQALASADVVEAIDPGPDDALVGPLAEARSTFLVERGDLERSLRTAAEVAAALEEFLTGPNTYLLLAANNAQMQAGQGMFLSFGRLSIVSGEIRLDDVRSAIDMPLPSPPVDLDTDYVDRWARVYDPNTDWRHLGMSPRYDMTAATAAAMWTSATGQQIDGVIAVDPVALSGLLEGTGPVEVDGETVDSSSVVEELLIEQYELTVDDEDPAGANAARRERLSVIADAVVAQLDAEVDPQALLDAMEEVIAGRHVLAWSADPVQQAGWVAAGIDGTLGERDLLLSVVNRGGNKLDPYLKLNATVDYDPATRELAIEVQSENTAPFGLPRYVEGPYDPEFIEAGEYRGVLTLHAPQVVSSPEVDAVNSYAVFGPDGPSWATGVWLELRRGERSTTTFTLTVGQGVEQLTVIPSARVPAVTWTWPAGSGDDRVPFTIPIPP